MFYFNKNDPRVTFMDIREVKTTLCDGRKFEVSPDIVGDFTNIQFPDNSFRMVVFNPPPNPTKVTDARSGGYISRFGHECWELDALEPKVITQLIENEVTALIDYDLFNAVAAQENRDKANIQLICERYDEVVDYLMDA